MRDIENGNMPSKSVFNVFESVVLPLCPLAEGAKKYLTELGAGVAMMSGSGPSVFGVFSDEGKARLAVKALEEKGYNAFYAHSV
jgi:4-diphosphocytidyl-2-C-methyl-D-erythritol kinase